MDTENGSLRARIESINQRPIFAGQPADIVSGVFPFVGTIVDNATTVVDLTAAAALRSKSAYGRTGATDQAKPTLVCLVNEIGIVLHGGVETDLIAQAVGRELYLHHKPAAGQGDMYYDLADFLTSISETGNGVIATGGFGAAMKAPTTKPLEVPLIVDLARDTFEIAPYTAVDLAGAGGMPFTLFVRGHIWHNRSYARSEWVTPLPGAGEDLHAIQSARAAGNATHRYVQGDVKAVVFHGVDANGKPTFKQKK